MSETRPIRFRFAPDKALAAVHWMAAQQPGVDLHAMLKGCYFADKAHLNAHGRPVFGATYRAMKFGPVPIEIYEMAKGEAIWLAETGRDATPWRLAGYRLLLESNEAPDLSALSESEEEALTAGFGRARSMTFTERTAATHGPDWQAARLGTMRYEDMLDDGPAKSAKVAYLREAAPLMRL